MNRLALTLLMALMVLNSGCTGIAAAASLDASATSGKSPATSQATASAADRTPTATALTAFPITPTVKPDELSTAYDDAAPVVVQLAAGTLELDGTDQAVTQDQAVALLPLWQDYLGMEQDGTASMAEVAAAESQPGGAVSDIELMMTPAQLHAIADLQITQQSLETLLGAPASAAEAQAEVVASVVQYLRATAAQ